MYSVAEKIKMLRMTNKISQEEFAEELWTSPSAISRVENGKGEYAKKQLEAAKKLLGITGMPLTEPDTTALRARLYFFRDTIRRDDMEEARKIYSTITNIVNLEPCLEPCFSDLPMLFRMFEIMFLRFEGDLAGSEEKLDAITENDLKKMNAEHLYYYYYNRGALHNRHERYEESLDFLKQAVELAEDNKDLDPIGREQLYVNIAYCYTYLEYPTKAILFLSKIRGAYSDGRVDIISLLRLDLCLAENYIRINELDEADKLLNACYIKAKGIEDEIFLNYIEHNFGLLYKQVGKWDESIKRFEKVVALFEKGSASYFKALYQNIYCLVEIRKFSKAQKLIQQTKSFHSTDKVFAILFEALGRYIEIKSRLTSRHDDSVKYIETIAIPHFEKTYDYFIAMEYYSLLELYYEKKSIKQSLLMRSAISRINDRCFINAERR